jgi:hypothetical protein
MLLFLKIQNLNSTRLEKVLLETFRKMQLIVFKFGNENPIPIDLPTESDVDMLRQMIQVEFGIAFDEQILLHNEKNLERGTLIEQGVLDGDIIVLKQNSNPKVVDNSSYSIPQNVSPEDLLKLAQSNPKLIKDLKYSDRELANCLETNDISKVRQFMMARYMSKHKAVYTRQQEYETMLKDPNNPELQKKLEHTVSFIYSI